MTLSGRHHASRRQIGSVSDRCQPPRMTSLPDSSDQEEQLRKHIRRIFMLVMIMTAATTLSVSVAAAQAGYFPFH